MAVVLVVDDDPDMRSLLAINLEGAGYDVTLAADGAEALGSVRAARPDALLLDVMMPVVDGWAVLDELKREGGADIPVFVVTAVDDAETRTRAVLDGALRCVTKPFDPAELIDDLARVLAPEAAPEPELRRRVQAATLEMLARGERHHAAPEHAAPRVRLTRLERWEDVDRPGASRARARERFGQLTDRQRQMVGLLARGRSITEAAAEVGTSRSSAYDTVRRIARRLGLDGGSTLIRLARAGAFETTGS